MPTRITSPYAPDLGEVRAWLERMIRTLRFVELVTAIVAFISRVCEVNAELTKKLTELRRARPRSETLERIERQLVLSFVDLVQQAEGSKPPVRPDEQTRSRKGRHPGRDALPAHLERVEVTNPVPPSMRMCPICGTEMTTVGHSRCERLSVIPAKVVVEVRLDERVACPKDDTIVSAPVPPAIVEGGKLADALIVEATCDKYLEHAPVERQCTRYARRGVEIAPQTLRRGVAAHIDLLTPVARLIEKQTRAPGLLGTDSTGLPILDREVVDGIRTGAMWCWTNACWVTFFYSPSADSASVRRFLGDDIARTVQCDGTPVTTFIEKAGGKRPGCWSSRTETAGRGGARRRRSRARGPAQDSPALRRRARLQTRRRQRRAAQSPPRRAHPARPRRPASMGRGEARGDGTEDPARQGARLPAPAMEATAAVPRRRQHRGDA